MLMTIITSKSLGMSIRNATVEMMPAIFKVDPGAFKAIAVGSNEDS